MISFKEYLTEARMAPLYHGTYLFNLDAIILKREGILPITIHAGGDLLKRKVHSISGVSTTRSRPFARAFRGLSGGAVVLELDQAALAQRYEIRPIQYWQNLKSPKVPARSKEKIGPPIFNFNSKNEYEEFIITKKAIPVKYITGIIVERTDINHKTVKAIADTYGSSFIKTF